MFQVITAGTAIRESLELLRNSKAVVCGVVVSLDRQEMVSETVYESAIQQVEKSAGVPVVSIVRLNHLVAYLQAHAQSETDVKKLESILQYRKTYGVEY
jgi:orotate phosphoribosyltransferase